MCDFAYEENDSWFVASEDEGIVRIAFVVDIEEEDEDDGTNKRNT